MRKRNLLIGTAAVLAAVAVCLLLLWRGGVLLPRWADFRERETAFFRLSRGQLTLNGFENWSPGETVRVQDALICDIDADGADELVLLCWRIGSYGAHRPFWVRANDRAWGQHIFIYELERDGPRPSWMSSALSFEIASWTLLRGRWLCLSSPDGEESLWGWLRWGLERLERLPGEDGAVELVAVGDLLCHNAILDQGRREGSFDFLFAHLSARLTSADLAVLNQESVLVSEPGRVSAFPPFGAPLALGQAVADAPFGAVTLANNHALDQGAAGLQDTKTFYARTGVAVLGSGGACTIIEKNSVHLALLNYTYGTDGHPLPERDAVSLLDDEARIRRELRAARSEADALAVFVHWGTEYAAAPDGEQRRWAQLFADEGADLVIGTHPHVLQGVEKLSGDSGHETVVFWSLGNFVSNQQSAETNLGGLARVRIEKDASGCRITDWALEGLVTHQEPGLTTVYPLAAYSDTLAAKHSLGLTKAALETLFETRTQRELPRLTS